VTSVTHAICTDCREQRKIHSRGRCTSCYRRHLKELKADGSYVPIVRHPLLTPFEKVMSRVDKRAGGCWLYAGALAADGYARVKDAGSDLALLVHRVTYEQLVGPIPEGLVLDHLCRVRHCVNPEHLEPVTHMENLRRGVKARLGERTHCSEGHEFTPENTTLQRRNRKDGGTSFTPICRTCRRVYGKSWEARKRAAPNC
jgi:hypothetical protein